MIKEAAALAGLAMLAGTMPITAPQQAVSESRSAPRNADVEIRVPSGSVRVVGWDRDEVRVGGTVSAEQRLRFEVDEGDVEVGVVTESRQRRRDVAASELEVTVPWRASLQIETLSATVDVSGMGGEIDVVTAAGTVNIEGEPREVTVETAGGDVEISTTLATREVDVETASGRVVLRVAGGEVSVATLTGDIEVAADAVGDGSFESVSGQIRFEGNLDPSGEYSFENFSGGIEILVPESSSARFDVRNYAGDIANEFGFEAERTDRYAPERQLEFSLGAGGAEVDVENFSGGIIIRRR